MKIHCEEGTLHVSDVPQLTTAEAPTFRSAIAAALGPEVRHVQLDLSGTEQFDCGGLGALIALRKSLRQHHGGATIALCDPAPAVQRLLQLTRTDLLFASAAPRFEASPHF